MKEFKSFQQPPISHLKAESNIFTIQRFKEMVETLSDRDKKNYEYLTTDEAFFDENGEEMILKKFIWMIFITIINILYCIVHFIEIEKLSNKIMLMKMNSFDFSIQKISLSITIFLLFLINLENDLSRIILVVINILIYQVIRFILFKNRPDILSEYVQKPHYPEIIITVICIGFSLVYSIRLIFSKYYNVEVKITNEKFINFISKLKTKQNLSLQMKLLYIQFLMFYFLTMRTLNNKFKIFENLTDFKIYFCPSAIFLIYECIEFLIQFFNPYYQTNLAKYNCIIRIPTHILSIWQFIYYIYVIRKNSELKFSEMQMMHAYGLILFIINIAQFIIDSWVIDSNVMDKLKDKGKVNSEKTFCSVLKKEKKTKLYPAYNSYSKGKVFNYQMFYRRTEYFDLDNYFWLINKYNEKKTQYIFNVKLEEIKIFGIEWRREVCMKLKLNIIQDKLILNNYFMSRHSHFHLLQLLKKLGVDSIRLLQNFTYDNNIIIQNGNPTEDESRMVKEYEKLFIQEAIEFKNNREENEKRMSAEKKLQNEDIK